MPSEESSVASARINSGKLLVSAWTSACSAATRTAGSIHCRVSWESNEKLRLSKQIEDIRIRDMIFFRLVYINRIPQLVLNNFNGTQR